MTSHRHSRKLVLRLTLAATALATLTMNAAAGGLRLYEIAAPEVGLASAGFGARALDASTVLSNPAGMTRLEGRQVMAGGQLVYGDVQLASIPTPNTSSGGDGGNAVGWLPGGSAFVSYSPAPGLKIGFGVASQFGAAEDYDSGWAGRYYVKEATLGGISLLPSVAYRVNERLSVGATLHAMYGILDEEIAVNNALPRFADGELKLDDKVWGWGLNLGLLYELDEATRFSLTYNSQVDLDFKPTLEFTGLAPGLETLLANRRLLNAQRELGIKVPQSVMASFYHRIAPEMAILGSLGWEEWSKFGKIDVGVEGTELIQNKLQFNDTWHAAIGAQYKPNGPWTYNVGMAYESSFQDKTNVSPLLPANGAWRYGIGVENEVRKGLSWGVSAAYLYGGSLGTNRRSILPVALGGRGDLVGSYKDIGLFFLSAHANWKF